MRKFRSYHKAEDVIDPNWVYYSGTLKYRNDVEKLGLTTHKHPYCAWYGATGNIKDWESQPYLNPKPTSCYFHTEKEMIEYVMKENEAELIDIIADNVYVKTTDKAKFIGSKGVRIQYLQHLIGKKIVIK
jgi:hypothetical protein